MKVVQISIVRGEARRAKEKIRVRISGGSEGKRGNVERCSDVVGDEDSDECGCAI